jgi:hypothetical protein
MRRGTWIWVLLLVVVVATAVGIGAYNAGLSEGLEEAGRAGEVVRVVGPDRGFFPFGLFLFPLFFFGLFFLARAAFWGRGWHGHGPWGPGGRREAIEGWHRRLHEEGPAERPASGEGHGTA